MEEDKLTQLFASYQPAMTPDRDFMSRLKRNMAAVESVRNQVAQMRRKNRLAVIVAAVTGFICGIISTLAFPYLMNLSENILQSMSIPAQGFPEGIGFTVTVICIFTSLLTFSAYDLTLILTKARFGRIRLQER